MRGCPGEYTADRRPGRLIPPVANSKKAPRQVPFSRRRPVYTPCPQHFPGCAGNLRFGSAGICRSGHGNRNGNTVWLYEHPVRSTSWPDPARMQDHPADGKKHVRQRLPGMTRSQPDRTGAASQGVWRPAARPEDERHRYRCCGRWFHAGVQPSVRLPRQPCRQEAKRSGGYGRQDIIWYGAGARPCVPDRPAGFPVHCRRSTAPPATMPANRTSAPARSRNSMSRQRASP